MELKQWLKYWRLFTVFATPLILSIMFAFSTSKETLCGYVIIVMAIYWMTEALPLAVTALIPVFAFPLLGILSSAKVTTVYMKETNMMFIGGLIVAIAVEHSNLHKRIALFVILHVGQSPRRLMAGFMITTMFLSMWISNTASTAMMVPIVDAVLQELYKASTIPKDVKSTTNGNTINEKSDHDQESGQSQIEMTENPRSEQSEGRVNEGLDITEEAEKPEKPPPLPPPPPPATTKSLTAVPPNKECRAMKDMYFLATAYAANIGGTGSLTGTGPNLVVKQTLQSAFPKQNDLNFASWMLFNIPGMLLCTFTAWVWLQVLFMGFGKKSKLPKSTPETRAKIKQLITNEYKKLGKITFHEAAVLIVFINLVLFWFFREPGFVVGWADRFKENYGDDFKLGDAVPAILAASLLFAIPSRPNFWPSLKFKDGPSPSCLNWDIIHDKLPWGIVLLLGGGFAMAEASKTSGLSIFLGEKLRSLQYLPVSVSVLILSVLTAMATEVASNTATASIIMPILKELAIGICVNPLYFMLPAAVCCSYAFMLPVATPPNAIAFGAAGMRTIDMMKAGFVMNILCVLVINAMINVLGIPMFDLTEIPQWVNSTGLNISVTCQGHIASS